MMSVEVVRRKRFRSEDGYRLVVVEERYRRPQVLMELQMVRGSSFLTPADGAGVGGNPGCRVTMDAAVWRKMPEEMIWEVLRFLPAAKLFQLQLVSRRWRQVLISTNFRKRLVAAAAAKAAAVAKQQQEEERVVVCVWPRPYLPHYVRSSSNSSSSCGVIKVLSVDLWSIVPTWFWNESGHYTVVAGAHGLVCISNDAGKSALSQQPSQTRDVVGEGAANNRHCVLNPLTRTCVVLPELPFQPDRWLLPDTSSVAILSASGTAWRWATFDLAAGTGAGWVAAHTLHMPNTPDSVDVHQSWLPPGGALMDGKAYWYTPHDNRVHVTTTTKAQAQQGPRGPGGQAEEEVGALAGPSVTLLGFDEASLWTRGGYPRSVLTAHQGTLYFVAPLNIISALDVLCGVWRLVRAADGSRMVWEGVATLEEQEVERLTGAKMVKIRAVYGVRELVCCQLMAVAIDGVDVDQVDHQRPPFRPDQVHISCIVVGFNLDKGNWELVHSAEDLGAPMAMELRPDVFLF